jgi:hypothetical protein
MAHYKKPVTLQLDIIILGNSSSHFLLTVGNRICRENSALLLLENVIPFTV